MWSFVSSALCSAISRVHGNRIFCIRQLPALEEKENSTTKIKKTQSKSGNGKEKVKSVFYECAVSTWFTMCFITTLLRLPKKMTDTDRRQFHRAHWRFARYTPERRRRRLLLATTPPHTTLPRAAYFIGRPGGINVKYANTSTVWIQIFAQHRVSKLVSQNCASVASIYFHFIVCVACAKGAEKEHLSSVLFIQFENGACGMGKCFNWKLAAQFELNVPPRIRLVRFGIHTRAIQRRDEATLECGSINCVILMADISIDFIFLLFLLETFCTLHLSDEFVFN